MISYWIDTLVLKNCGKYLRYFTTSSSPLRGNPTQCSRGSKKNFWRRSWGVRAKVNYTKYPSQTHLPRIYIICHLPLVFLSPTSPLSFYSPSVFQSPPLFLFRLFIVCLCLCVGLLVAMAQDNTKLCDFSNTNNNDFLSTLIAPLKDVESCEINTALLNLVMKDQFAGLPSEDAATHLNNFVDLCDMQKNKDVDNDIVKL